MNPITRRLATIALGGTLAVGSLSGCGIFSSALDCGKLNEASQHLIDAGSDTDKMKSALDELETAADDVDDADLKQAVKDLTSETKKSMEVLDNPESADPNDVGDTKKIESAANTIQDKCG